MSDPYMAFAELAGIYEFMDGHDRETAERMATERLEARTAKQAATSATNGGQVDTGTL